MPLTKRETKSQRRGITRRGFMTKGAVAGAAATALYVAPQFTTTFATRAYAQVTGACIWAAIGKIDFEMYPLAGGGEAATVSGQHIDGEYSPWGVTVSTSRSDHPAMIFDSEAANAPGGFTHVTGGDHDLRTPSASGGHASEALSNDKHLHKVLIVSEDHNPDDPFSDPDDDASHASGSELFFDFAIPTAVTYVDILDMDDGNSTDGSGRAKLWQGAVLVNNGGVNGYKFPPLGNNSWQRISIDASDQVAITRLEIEFNSSGAIAEIGFKCP